ncbi:MAG TPA: hypothetical protein VEB67_01680 [Nitrososphaerales archaeon]|nr:hypothetical protein [Nitrososphaerales archaeon]
MVDATTLTLLATIVQTVVISLTLLIFIFQFRSQERAVKESSYQNLLGRYNEMMMSWSDDGEDMLISRLVAPGKELDPKEKTTVRRLLLSYGIIEEAYELYKKKWIDEESWEQWNTWLKAICRNPLFVMLHSSTAGMYDKDFQDHVTKMIAATGPGTP